MSKQDQAIKEVHQLLQYTNERLVDIAERYDDNPDALGYALYTTGLDRILLKCQLRKELEERIDIIAKILSL